MALRTILILICLIALCSPLWAQDIEAEIIQIRLDRIYFGGGEDLGIYVGAPFVIECGEEKPVEGIIDFVGPGISYSRPLPRLDTLLFDSECRARLTVSKVDTTAEIIIGTDLPLEFFDPAHETLFRRVEDTVIGHLVDSSRSVGNRLDLFLPADIRFSDGSRLDAETLAASLSDLKTYGSSDLTRYFFSKLLPLDSGGIEVLDGFSLRLLFYHPLPRAEYFLAHPNFAISKRDGLGTGALAEIGRSDFGNGRKTFIVNHFYHGDRPAFRRLTIQHFRQSFRMRFAYDNGLLDGFVGFGFDDILAGSFQAEALYPEMAVMMAGIGGEAFFDARFVTSLYYRFDPDFSHLFFPDGETIRADCWMADDDSVGRRYYDLDFQKGQQLHRTLTALPNPVKMVYDDHRLAETARFLADIAAREGTSAEVKSFRGDNGFDIKLTFVPVSDGILPSALFCAVVDLNDQNAVLSEHLSLDRPGWAETDRGSRLYEIDNRRRFFYQAEEIVVEKCGCFPLFRPRVFAVALPQIKNIGFDFYGFPVVDGIEKFKRAVSGGRP